MQRAQIILPDAVILGGADDITEKKHALNAALGKVFETAAKIRIECITIPARVASGQPFGEREMWRPAHLYAECARRARPRRSEKGILVYLAIESGITFEGGNYFLTPCAVALTSDGYIGVGKGGGIHIPAAMAKAALREGSELGAVVRARLGTPNASEDPAAYLTEGMLSYTEALAVAAAHALMSACGIRYRREHRTK